MDPPGADMKRLSIKRENGGRGFIQLELTNKTTTIGFKKIVTDYHRLDGTVNKHTREAWKYSSKESNKFTY